MGILPSEPIYPAHEVLPSIIANSLRNYKLTNLRQAPFTPQTVQRSYYWQSAGISSITASSNAAGTTESNIVGNVASTSTGYAGSSTGTSTIASIAISKMQYW